MKYGLPYKGSKNKLATRIVSILPQRKNLYDLFCGGCAVTHAAMMGRKFENFYINDINWMCPTLFRDVLAGKYDNENRWISREDFFRLKDTDPYVAFVWSFGNNLRDYIYGKEIEPVKKAIHYAIFFADYSLGKELGHDLSFIDGITDIQERYLSVKHYFENRGGNATRTSQQMVTTQRLETFERSVRYGGAMRMQSLEATSLLQATSRNAESRSQKSVHRDFKKKNLSATSCRATDVGTTTFRLQYRERHNSFPNFGGGQNNLFTSSGDYQSVDILPDSVIYCDIPYRETNVYDKENDFNYERFYDWACSQSEPVFISEYWMPEDRFKCVQEFVHRSTLCATANNAVHEKLFVPIGQETSGQVQLSLW